MKPKPHQLVRAALGVALSLCIIGAAQGQMARSGDPARWYQDDRTPAAQTRTLQKEINAAYQQAQASCRHEHAAAQSGCLKEARANYRRDMAELPELRAEAHPRQ